jgi:exodeoxyribonuclease V alpha subunit
MTRIDVEKIAGEVSAIVFREPEDDWSVLTIIPDGLQLPVTVTGYTTATQGQSITATGEWKQSPKWGRQFVATQIAATSPATTTGLFAYLTSGAIKGIGPALAQTLIDRFGMEVLAVLENEPERLKGIRGLGSAKLEKVRMQVEMQREMQSIMLFLHSQSIPAGLCRRIHKAYGDDTIAKLSENPYRLCFEVSGIGFKTADDIGMRLGVPHDSPQRVLAGLSHLMSEITQSGHCGCARDAFIERATSVMNVPRTAIDVALAEALGGLEPLFIEHDAILYAARLARAEERIAQRLKRLLATVPAHADRVTDELVDRAAGERGMALARKQRLAVQMALTHKVSIITGGPGCGKTATLNVVLAALKMLRLHVALAAPTGKAAQRAREATGMDAMTVHRLLGLKGQASVPSKIHADVVVIDECSMIDVTLMANIVSALEPNTCLILVGDVDQLPSVGPGQVLADMKNSGVIPVTVLDEIFRQAAGSAIIVNAHAINNGRMPVSANDDGDFFVLTEQSDPVLRDVATKAKPEDLPAAMAQAVADTVIAMVGTMLPARYALDPVFDIQVLAPMNKGVCGVHELNRRLQEALNPKPARWVTRGGLRYGVGDKVIQSRNNYELGIYNGDIGYVADVDDEREVVRVWFDMGQVSIPFDSLVDLKLAYAMTIHKSQGSQAPAIVIPMVTQHWTLLQRNLLYTGVTRAAKLAFVVGQGKAIRAAVRTTSSTKRLTRLSALLAAA